MARAGASRSTAAPGRWLHRPLRVPYIRSRRGRPGADGVTDYKGKEKAIFRLGLGPDDKLYASTAMPIHFLRADPDSAAWEELGIIGGGEMYSFLAWGDQLMGAAY